MARSSSSWCALILPQMNTSLETTERSTEVESGSMLDITLANQSPSYSREGIDEKQQRNKGKGKTTPNCELENKVDT